MPVLHQMIHLKRLPQQQGGGFTITPEGLHDVPDRGFNPKAVPIFGGPDAFEHDASESSQLGHLLDGLRPPLLERGVEP